jgi:hypothetical protein
MKVQDLEPGMTIQNGPMSAIFIAKAHHPKYPGLMLVIWKLDSGIFSFDALSPHQEVGDLLPNPIGAQRRWGEDLYNALKDVLPRR